MERAQAGDIDTAAELFRQASDHGHTMAASLLASLLKDRGQLAEAETHYRRALASGLPPDQQQLIADCEVSLGYIRTQRGDDAEAEQLYRSADARGSLDAAFNLGNLLNRTGREQEAEHIWRRAAAAGQADAAYNLAELVSERGDLEEAERLLRQAIAAGITDAINNLGMVRLKRDDPAEAEALLRQAVAAGDHSAIFNLGLVLNVRGNLTEAEAVFRQAAAAGHPDAAAHLERLAKARDAEARLRQGAAAGDPEALYHLGLALQQRGQLDEAQQMLRQAAAAGHAQAATHLEALQASRPGWPATESGPAHDHGGFVAEAHHITVETGDLSMLFRSDISTAERAKVLRAFATAVRARLHVAASSVGHGRDAVAERSAQLLSEVAARLPIRTADVLRSKFGDDPETQSQQVIAEAGRLAGWLWTAAAAVPGPPPVVHAIKVILHCAVEVRMTGELYAIHSDASRDQAWLGTVLLAWAIGQPVTPGTSVAASNTSAIVVKVRRSVIELASATSRLATVASRGRAGTSTVLRSGARMHRRMRLHPTMWVQPSGQSIGTVAREAIVDVAVGKLAQRVPQALATVARDRLASPNPSTSAAPPGAGTLSGPWEALTLAWALHQQAAGAGSATSTSDPVAARLNAALRRQERLLQALGRQLGKSGMAIPAQRVGRDAGEAGQLVWQAEDAIDLVEDMGARSRRLASWSTRRRAGLVYLVTSLVVSALPVAAIVDSSGLGRVGLLLAQCLVLPWLSLVAGAIAIGPLFRPWLGGPVTRHPVIGMWIVIGAHTVLGLSAAAFSALA